MTSHFFKDVDARERAVSSALRTAASNASEGGYGTGHARRRRLSSRKRRTDYGSVKLHGGQVVRKMKASSVPLLARMFDTLHDAGMLGSPKAIRPVRIPQRTAALSGSMLPTTVVTPGTHGTVVRSFVAILALSSTPVFASPTLNCRRQTPGLIPTKWRKTRVKCD